jgi:septin family protein
MRVPLGCSWRSVYALTSVLPVYSLILIVESEAHCDFRKLCSLLIRTHTLDLIHTTEEQHYKHYRFEQMEARKPGEAHVKKPDNPKFKEDEEALRKRFTEPRNLVSGNGNSICASSHLNS